MKTDRSAIMQKNSVENRVRNVFTRMSQQIGRVAKEVSPENVHRFRTNARRVEALVQELAPESGETKLLKQLSRLRKRAGKLRDLDVQIAFIEDLKVPDRQHHRVQLLGQMVEEKTRRARKLAQSFHRDTVRKLRNRLRKSRAELDLAGVDPLKMAFALLPKPEANTLTEKELHACRIAAKRARYLAELSDSPTAKTFVEELKRTQDAVGEWHDVMKLSERAEKLFGGVRDSVLVAALQNIARARFRRASSSLLNALHAVAELQQDKIPARRSTEASVPAGIAAA